MGVKGVVIISHGGSTAVAIRNAIRVAGQAVEQEVNNHIVTEITSTEKNHIKPNHNNNLKPDQGKETNSYA